MFARRHVMATPKLMEVCSNGRHESGPDDDGSEENLVYGNLGSENADGPAVQTGAWIADVTYERAASQLESANNLKQLGLAVIHFDGSPSPVESDYSGAHALYQDVIIV
jgi:hypothetical protein